jgi:hypothetical protein
VGDKTSRWDYRERWLQPVVKVREEWDNLDRVKTFLVALASIYGMVWKFAAAPNDKILFQVIRQLLIQMWWI